MFSKKYYNIRNVKDSAFILGLFCLGIFLLASNFSYAGGGPSNEAYLAFAEVMPEPVDGYTSMFKKITYPDMARSAGVEGKLYLLVFVNENGGVDDIKVIKSLGAGCDEAAIKAVKDTKFKPGKNSRATVKVKLSIPVTFKLQ